MYIPLANEDVRIFTDIVICERYIPIPVQDVEFPTLSSSLDRVRRLTAGSVRATQLSDFTDPAIKLQDDGIGRRRITTVGGQDDDAEGGVDIVICERYIPVPVQDVDII